ncbi:APH(3'') family aminoglycoside O-phosphotransferase [Nocardia beijingensis]|uniref:APH(3'') family aminoglycoside O-phosphotransferase n=1 Tax=Nocardia beijingensis TaxID=95162 RepID=UPI0018948476|nr:APH(3'') family aminoglycoside O-phosphotransferase [Nocardia beijingensis]MBF6465176.1 APH(3'') family aminoglycoside O-phosphotransferase [Nocardia beijingensis]
MSESLVRFRAALPSDRRWEPVGNGESGAEVFRSADGSRYAKCVDPGRAADLALERDKVVWLDSHEIPGPRVLDWRTDADGGACLVTSAVPGIAADAVPVQALSSAWASIAETVRRLHELPVEECPFDRGLARMFAIAQDVVVRGAVHTEFLPEEQQDTPPTVLLTRLATELGQRMTQESAEAVVCHGDLCLPNIILDPDTHTVAGFVDLGRLGVADPYADIALLLANARESWQDERRAEAADRAFADRYGIALDVARQRFFLHLDPLTWG